MSFSFLMILPYRESHPQIGADVFVADSAAVIGRVRLHDRASVWFGAVLRGDVAEIEVGEESNVQDLCVIHTTGGVSTCHVGKRVTVGHRAILHGCLIGDSCLIGMGSVILDNAEIGEGSLIAAGSVVLENAKIPPRSFVAGVPAKIKGEVDEERLRSFLVSASTYVGLARDFMEQEP